MILAKMILAGSLFAIVSAAASAQATPPTQQAPSAETRKGLVTIVNRLNGTIAIREEQDDKGKEKDKEGKEKEKDKAKADAEDMATRFKIDHKLSESVHAGDKVKFSVRDGGDPNTEKTITKIDVD
jgi:ABC-type glutathione transport system ATPase component